MKSLRLPLLILLFSGGVSVMAQQATEGLRPFVKRSSGNAVSIIYTGQPDNVEKVLEEWMEEASGERASNYKGFRSWEGVRVQAFSDHTFDYYLGVDKLSRQDKEHTEVTLFVSAGNENFLSSSDNPRLFQELIFWLESQQKEITLFEIGLAIEAQEKVLEKANKEYDKLQRDSVNLQTTLAETLAAIEENKMSNQTQRQSISAEEDKLQAFRNELEAVRTGNRDAIMRTGEDDEIQIDEGIHNLEEAPNSSGDGN